MVDAVFLSFYGAVAHNIQQVVTDMAQRIWESGRAKDRAEVERYWQRKFELAQLSAHGSSFQSQRQLVMLVLEKTLRRFRSPVPAKELSLPLFQHWVRPPLFEDAKAFLAACPAPVYLLANMDRRDIENALHFHQLKVQGLITSEDARAYKPRKELFQLALRQAGVEPKQALSLGGSLRGDLRGASALGIPALWLNRIGRRAPNGIPSVRSLSEALDTQWLRESPPQAQSPD